MKLKINRYHAVVTMTLAVVVMAAVAFSGCSRSFEMPELPSVPDELTPNISIIELKKIPATQAYGEIPNKAEGESYKVSGYVISSDASANLYATLILQDATGALPLAVSYGNLDALYPPGTLLTVDLDGLCFQNSEGWMLIGAESGEPASKSVNPIALNDFKFLSKVEEREPKSPITIDYSASGQKYPDAPYQISLTCRQLKEILPGGPEGLALAGQLVSLPDVAYELTGEENETLGKRGEETDRVVTDKEGSAVKIRISGNSTLCTLPVDDQRGRIRGILCCENGEWIIVPRGYTDLINASASSVGPAGSDQTGEDQPGSDQPGADKPGGADGKPGGDENKPGGEGDENSSHTSAIAATGDGSFDNPYNIAAVRALAEDEPDIWVEGYVAGFVQGVDFISGATFRPVMDADDYDGSNLILSDFPGDMGSILSSDIDLLSGNTVPVRLNGVFKRLYGLREHPEYMNIRIKINCDTGAFFGTRSLHNLTQFLILR